VRASELWSLIFSVTISGVWGGDKEGVVIIKGRKGSNGGGAYSVASVMYIKRGSR
jgi:hypothetical protein